MLTYLYALFMALAVIMSDIAIGRRETATTAISNRVLNIVFWTSAIVDLACKGLFWFGFCCLLVFKYGSWFGNSILVISFALKSLFESLFEESYDERKCASQFPNDDDEYKQNLIKEFDAPSYKRIKTFVELVKTFRLIVSWCILLIAYLEYRLIFDGNFSL